MKILTLDIETTGLPAKGLGFMNYPHIVSLAYKVNDEKTKYFIVNQEGLAIPPESIAIHGITDDIANASDITLSKALSNLLFDGQGADITVGHNIYFDISIIKANVLRLISGQNVPQAFYDQICELLHKDRRIDTMQSTIKFCNIPGPRGAKWPKLTELYFKLFNENFEAHNSKEDVDATHRCYIELKKRGII